MFNVGDRVRITVAGTKAPQGTVTTVSGIWNDQEHPYELDGLPECYREDELELTV